MTTAVEDCSWSSGIVIAVERMVCFVPEKCLMDFVMIHSLQQHLEVSLSCDINKIRLGKINKTLGRALDPRANGA